MIVGVQLGTQQRDVRIVPHESAWRQAFAAESARVREAVGDLLVSIEHVGSTSVPGLAAKPTVDMQATVAVDPIPIERLAAVLAPLGYVHVPFPSASYYPMFAKPASGHRDFHLHFCHAGGDQELRHLAFRDYLRAHPEAAAEYADLKRELAARHADDRPAYVAGKDGFVKALERRALEWTAAR